MVLQLLFVTSAMVFANSLLRLIVCIYRNSAILVSEEYLVSKFSSRALFQVLSLLGFLSLGWNF